MLRTALRLCTLALLTLFGCGNSLYLDWDGDFIADGDLPEIREQGVLRILTDLQTRQAGLSFRDTSPQERELLLAESFARSQFLKPVRVYVDRFDELIPALKAGRGDIIAANMTATDERRRSMRFTTPVAFVRELLIGRPGEMPQTTADLKGKRIAVRQSSSYYGSLQKLLKTRYQPAFNLIEVDESLPYRVILDRVARGEYDYTVLDSNQAHSLVEPRSDLEVGFSVSPIRQIAWAVRGDSEQLQGALNAYLSHHHLASTQPEQQTGDLSAILERGVLRVATRNNAATYFVWRGELVGFEYELAKRFAKRHNLVLEMVVPPRRDELLPWLLEGKVDLVAASLTIPGPGDRPLGIDFSHPYNTVLEEVVSRDCSNLNGVADLAGREVYVRRSSSYWRTLQKLNLERGLNIHLKAASETMETEQLLARVAEDKLPITISDSHILDIEQSHRKEITDCFSLGEPKQHGWAVRSGNPELLQAVNRFIKEEYRSTFYNLTYAKYFKRDRQMRRYADDRYDRNLDGSLSPFDRLVRHYATPLGLDWRLVVAQMYEESRFNPEANSWMGAKGLMQVLPKTAQSMGMQGDLYDPKTSIKVGVTYLHWLTQRFEPEIPVSTRIWFALAAYNAGIGHVHDARRLARKEGLDPNRWFDNVELAMQMLSDSEHAQSSRYGYVRGHEPVAYVQAIRRRLRAYLEMSASL